MTERENLPDHTGQPRLWGRSSAEHERRAVSSKVSLLGYVCLCLNLFLFGYLLVAAPQSYSALGREDRWVENLTAVWFLLAGLLLCATALFERSFFRRCIYVLGGMVMVFIAGEEISWGQRIFGFATPDFLLGLNDQGEFNLHNIDAPLAGEIFRYGALMLCTITGAAFFCRKDALFGLPLPSLLTMFCFLVAMAYAASADPQELRSLFGVFDLTVYFSDGRNLLLLFFFYFLLSRQIQWLVISAATVTLVLPFLFVHESSSVNHGVDKGIEVQEYLFGLVCFFYALEMLVRRRAAPVSWMPFASIKLRVARISLWGRIRSRSERALEAGSLPVRELPGSPVLWVCSFVIACSVGLALFHFLSVRAAVSAAAETYRSIVSGAYGEPAGRSTYDVYLVENRLIYFLEPCSREDRALRFFLHLFPVDVDDLPDHRKQYGFDNTDFNFGVRNLGVTVERSCIRTVTLPDYAISRVVTGQFTGAGRLWEVKFSPP